MAVWPKFFKQHNENKEPVLPGYEMAVKAGYKGTYEEWLGLKMDSAPTEGSSRPITSGAVYSALTEAALQENESGGGSGGGIFFVTVTGGWDNDEFAGTSDKSVSEIISAWAAGNLPVLRVVSEGTLDPGPYFVYLYGSGSDEPAAISFKSLSGVFMDIGGADGKTVAGGYES